jgi:FkbH-like protein
MLATGKTVGLRDEIDRCLEAEPVPIVRSRISELWRNQQDLATASFVCSRYEKLRSKLNLVAHRTALLRSFTVEPIIPLLRAEAFSLGIDLAVHVGDFNSYLQEILDSSTSLYKFHPDSVILAVRTADVAPELWAQFADLTAEDVQKVSARVSSVFGQCIESFRKHSSASLIIQNLEPPVCPHLGILDAQSDTGQSESLRKLNRELRLRAAESRGVYIMDYNELQARHGRLSWQDDRKYFTTRLPLSGDNLIHLAREWLRFLVPLSGKIAKALVVDLDNTLWGGVIGEDGITGIKLGSDYPGVAYQSVQRALLDLSRKGILLAICSKNNPEDAFEVLEKHPGMLLKPQHFAAMRIGWKDKFQGLQEIAEELNIGIDSLAFLDDNPVEREQVRESLPEVTVIELPSDPFGYAGVIQACPVFERLSLSSEDQQRTAMYGEQRERTRSEQMFQSKEDFYRFLDQSMEIAPLSPSTLARISQLTQKTNQFNLTTHRYTEHQLQETNARQGWSILSIRVKDRFGDQGLVGVSITHDEGDTCEIETFLLSCRVIGRTVETALLSALASAAMKRGCKRLIGCFVPTRKNAPARDFYSQHGFKLESAGDEGSKWILDLTSEAIPFPSWIDLKIMRGANN